MCLHRNMEQNRHRMATRVLQRTVRRRMENLAERKKLLNPLNYIGSDSVDTAEHIRIRVGTRDGDTSLSTSAVLVLSLENKTDADVDYALVWDQPHGNADSDGELVQWIEKICKE